MGDSNVWELPSPLGAAGALKSRTLNFLGLNPRFPTDGLAVPEVRSSKISLRSKPLDHELANRDAQVRQGWVSRFQPGALKAGPAEAAVNCQIAFHKDCNALCLDCTVFGHNLKKTFARYQGAFLCVTGDTVATPNPAL